MSFTMLYMMERKGQDITNIEIFVITLSNNYYN